MLELVLIRHAESEANVRSHLVGGRQNHLKLTPKGELQAKLLGQAISSKKLIFDGIYVSPAVRTQRTAHYACILSNQTAPYIDVPEIQERTQGDAENKPIEKVYSSEVKAIIDRDPWNYKHTNGESMAEVETRAIGFITREFLEPKRNGCYALFTHGNTIRAIFAHAKGTPLPHYYELKVGNTSITRLAHTGSEWRVICFAKDFHSAYK